MKTMSEKITNTAFGAAEITLKTKSITSREGVLMNLISSIMIKDKDIKKVPVDRKKSKINKDPGFSIYEALEFYKDNNSQTYNDLKMEMLCSKLVY